MDFGIVTIFPEIFDSFLSHGIIRRAIADRIITVRAVNVREFAKDRHRTTDDRPYGGGAGMVMKPEPLAGAIAEARRLIPAGRTILLSPQGRPFTQSVAAELATLEGLIFICGRYEGVDERIAACADEAISIGDYVLTGGEPAAMILIDAVTRLLPGALGGEDSAEKDSFSDHLLEYAQYTRPPVFAGEDVPEVLLSGNHALVEDWRLQSSLARTLANRPDLLKDKRLTRREKQILKQWCDYIEGLVSGPDSDCAAASSGEK
ncbi:MAG: tRNA (guanosine(37)-N1)-methyltransferase TrmD [Desulfobacterales bacterium CG23_combo_of_CG06-09_8_20_14_all_51_8]|nr:MAG: tRNA (guanosine(37)-N1)-methyltransferase TrmD [Desulfobacterales bacterium CG23_combo_of_CG06-09_8_20_14_all_51_8]